MTDAAARALARAQAAALVNEFKRRAPSTVALVAAVYVDEITELLYATAKAFTFAEENQP